MTRVILKRVPGERPTGEKMIEIKLIEKSPQEADRELIIRAPRKIAVGRKILTIEA